MSVLSKIVTLIVFAISEYSLMYGSILLGANFGMIIAILIGYLLIEIGIILK